MINKKKKRGLTEMTIHLGRRVSAEGWISFESNPHLKTTRRRIYDRCAPCLEGLLEQLESGNSQIRLGTAYDCWKIGVVLDNLDQCYAVLEKFEELFPDQQVYGKLGGDKKQRTKVVVFHTEEVSRRDELRTMLEQCSRKINPAAPIFISRGCANPYADLLGPWEDWSEVTAIRHKEQVEKIIARLRWSLYQRPNGTSQPE